MVKLTRVVVIGGGPAGLTTAIYLKRLSVVRHVTVIERDAGCAQHGWGISLNQAALETLHGIDPACAADVERHLYGWDRVSMLRDGEIVRAAGTPLSAISRTHLLDALRERCRDVGVELRFRTAFRGRELTELTAQADLVVGADGAASRVRAATGAFGTTATSSTNHYIWLATRAESIGAAMLFRSMAYGTLFAYAYPYASDLYSFIVECADATWHLGGFDRRSAEQNLDLLEDAFAAELAGARLMADGARWSCFTTVRNRRWHDGNVVLVGDAAHTTHFSVGLGTVLAINDALELGDALARYDDMAEALRGYEAVRRPVVEQAQACAAESQSWFERFERYYQFPPARFAFSWRTRQRITTYDRLSRMDPAFVAEVCRSLGASDGPAGAPVSVPEPVGTRLEALPPGTNRVVAVVGDADGKEMASVHDADELGPAGLVLVGLRPGLTAQDRFGAVLGGLPEGVRVGVSLGGEEHLGHDATATLITRVIREGAEIVEIDPGWFLPWDPDQAAAAAAALPRVRAEVCAASDAAGAPVILRVSSQLDGPERGRAARHLCEIVQTLLATGRCAAIDTAPRWVRVSAATAWRRAVEITDVLRNEAGALTMLTAPSWRRDDANTLVGAGRLDLIGVLKGASKERGLCNARE